MDLIGPSVQIVDVKEKEGKYTGNNYFWSLLGCLYVLLTVYWPRLQDIIPKGLGLLRSYDLFAIIVVYIVLIRAFKIRRFIFKESSILKAICFVVAARMISIIFSPHFSLSLLWSVFNYVEALAITWAFIMLADTDFISAALYTIIFITIFETIFGVAQVITSKGTVVGTGFASKRGVYELQTMLVLYGLIAYCQDYRKKITNILAIIVGYLGVMITVIRTAYVQLSIALIIGYFLLPKGKRRKYIFIGALLGWISIFIIVKVNNEWPLISTRLQQLISGTGSIGVRHVLWKGAYASFLRNPITGIGSGAFGRSGTIYYELANVWFKEGYFGVGLSIHNTMLGFLAETGIVGLITFMIYAYVTIKTSFYLNRTNAVPLEKAIAATVISGIFIDCIAGSSFHPITITLVAFVASYSINVYNKIC